jgi:transposase
MPSIEQERVLIERLWERVQAFLPVYQPSPQGGRPRASDRACFEAIVHVLRNGCRWRDIPSDLPSGPTCWRRHCEWTALGIWEKVWQIVVEELEQANLLDTEELFADATFTPAVKGGQTSAKPRSAKGLRSKSSPIEQVCRSGSSQRLRVRVKAN